jgi:hypothetical protein
LTPESFKRSNVWCLAFLSSVWYHEVKLILLFAIHYLLLLMLISAIFVFHLHKFRVILHYLLIRSSQPEAIVHCAFFDVEHVFGFISCVGDFHSGNAKDLGLESAM